MRLQELRPKEGAKNTITLADGVRYCMLISKKFICPRCNLFCGELVPVVDGALRARLRKQAGGLLANLPRTKVYCYNGCHEHQSWGWKNFDWNDQAALASIREWPAAFREKAAIDKERKVRRMSESGESP